MSHSDLLVLRADRLTFCVSRFNNPTALRFDPAEERRLLWKIDLYIVPTVAVLYLFCFIDRANIGKLNTHLATCCAPNKTNMDFKNEKETRDLLALSKTSGSRATISTWSCRSSTSPTLSSKSRPPWLANGSGLVGSCLQRRWVLVL